jgi:transposase
LFQDYQPDQPYLLPPSLDDLLDEDHLVRVVNEIIEKLDLTKIYLRYTNFGRPAYHPLMLLKVLFYGYAIGLRSSRKLAKSLETDIAFMWLAGANKPDFRTISDFRKDNLDYIKELFGQIITTCLDLGMTSVGKIAVDSTKIKSVASRRSIRDENSLTKELLRIEKEIDQILGEAERTDQEEDLLYGEKRGDELPKKLAQKETRKKEIEKSIQKLKKERNKKKIVQTEPEASLVKTEGRVLPGYNAQTVASEEGFILSQDVVQNQSDNYLLGPMLAKIKENTKRKPEQVLADAGYYSASSLEYIKKEKIEAYIPILKNLDKDEKKNRPQANNKFSKENFIYRKETDSYICPAGEVLTFEQTRKKKQNKLRRYRCPNKKCAFKKDCTTSAKGRSVDRLPYEELYSEMKEKMKTKEAKAIYACRKIMIEPIFSFIKGPLGFTRFYLKGLDKVKGEWSIICSAFNLVKIWQIQQKMRAIQTI